MLVIDHNKSEAIYIQLYKQLRNKMICGDLKPGEKMPSTRRLSQELNVSRNTVDLAYHQLASEGYIDSQPRKGYFVEALDFSPITDMSMDFKAQTPHKKDERQSLPIGNDRPDTLLDQDSYKNIKYDFKYGMLSERHLPIRQWQRLSNKCMKESSDKMAFYGPMFGEKDLREEIQKYLKAYRGVACDIDQIFIGAGVHYCLSMLCQSIGDHVTDIAMEEPGYHVTRSTFKNHGFRVWPIGLDECGIKVEDLKKTKAQAVYVTPSHQYPLGIIMPVSRRLELIDWAHKNKALIIEDDYSCHLRYNAKPVQSLQSISGRDVVYIGSFSKFLFPTLRVAYMVLPKDHVGVFKQLFEGYPSSVSYPVQKTLSLFMKEGHWESYLRKNRKIQKRKHDILVKALKDKFSDTINIYGMNAGLHLLIEVKKDLSESDLIERANAQGVGLYPTRKFWNDPDKSQFSSVVLGFGGIEEEDVAPAVEALFRAWND